MKIEVTVDFLQPIMLDKYEWVDVELPSGHLVTVFDDAIQVLAPGEARHKDGKKVWEP
jgi:hypothetical protein